MNDVIAQSRLYPTGGIGASQIGALPPWTCCPWQTRADVYMAALGLAKPRAPSLAMRRGIAQEDYLRQAFTLATGLGCADAAGVLLRHKDHPFVVAHPDGLLEGTGVELKRVEENDGTWGQDPEQLPQTYWLQCQHSMLAAGVQSWWFYAEIPRGGQGKAWLECRAVEFQAEPEVQAQIVESCKLAWAEIGTLHAALQKGDRATVLIALTELAQDDAEAIAHAAKIVYPWQRREPCPAPVEALPDLREFATQTRDRKAAEGNLAVLRAKIACAMKDETCWQWDDGQMKKRKDGALVFSAREA